MIIEKRQYTYLSILLFLIFTILISIILLKNKNSNENSAYINNEKVIENKNTNTKNKYKEYDKLNKLFKKYLNDFRNDLSKQAKSYKESRLLLNEILSPINFETPEYSKENYYFFRNYIAPNLRKKSDNIINIFEKYNNQLNKDFKNFDNNITKIFFEKWKKMSHEQISKYIDFFIKEEEIIKAYEDIIKFYYIHSNLMKFNEEKNELIFTKKEYKIKEQILLSKIEDLKNK